jgi:hypothetical protein
MRNVTKQRQELLEEMQKRMVHAGLEWGRCQAAINQVKMIREMLASFYEDLMVKYQRVTAFGISFTERKKRNDRFFKYVNLVFYHYKFTLDREPHRPVFFTTWSQRLWDLAENAVLTAFKVPARCADEAAPRQTALLRLWSQQGPGSLGSSFDLAMAGAASWTQRQWSSLLRRNGRNNIGGGGGGYGSGNREAGARGGGGRSGGTKRGRGGGARGGRGASAGGRGATSGRGRGGRGGGRPGRNRRGHYDVANVQCYACGKYGHYQDDCPTAAAAGTQDPASQ